MTTERDAYDEAVDYLRENPQEIRDAWISATSHFAGILFSFATPWRGSDFVGSVRGLPERGWGGNAECGCLTTIRRCPGQSVAWTEALTNAIAADHRLPKVSFDITSKHLPVFAEWQRRIDKELGRTPPVWAGPVPPTHVPESALDEVGREMAR